MSELEAPTPLKNRLERLLLLVPPFAQGSAFAFGIQANQKNSVEFGRQARRRADEGSVPVGDSELLGDRKDFVGERDVFFRAGYFGPVVEDCLASTPRFEERRDLIGAIGGVECRSR